MTTAAKERALVERPVVAICVGKDCRRRDEFPKACTALARDCDVIELKCLGVCRGPVVVIGCETDSPAVYSKVRKKRHRRLLIRAVVGDVSASVQLSSRLVTKPKVAASLARQLRRRRD